MNSLESRLTFEQGLLAAGISGSIAASLTAPLDVLKVRTQVGVAESAFGYRNTLVNLYSNEGWRSLWRGNLIACMRVFPHHFIQMATYNTVKIKLGDDCGRLTSLTAGIAGTSAGMLPTIILYPLDTVKTRLIVQPTGKKYRHFRGIYDAFRSIRRKEGFFILYRGLLTTIIAVAPYSLVNLITYHCWFNIYSWGGLETHRHKGLIFLQGCIASGAAHFVTFPFDTIRKKMQAWTMMCERHGCVDVNAQTMRLAFKETYKLYGLAGFWRGCVPSMVKIVPFTGLTYVAYEMMTRLLLYRNGYTLSPMSGTPHPMVDQTMRPHELWELTDEGSMHWQGYIDDGIE